MLPTLWFRNTWASWSEGTAKPVLKQVNNSTIAAAAPRTRDVPALCDRDTEMLFTENETNDQRIFGSPNPTPYVKDGINDYVVNGQKDAVNPAKTGTKASPHYRLTVGPGETSVVRLKLIARKEKPEAAVDFGGTFERTVQCPHERGGRILPLDHPPFRRGGCGNGDAAGARGHALDQAVLQL